MRAIQAMEQADLECGGEADADYCKQKIYEADKHAKNNNLDEFSDACIKCGSNNVASIVNPPRSIDEPACCLIVCVKCNYKWRI
jgi:DNA-directed RNA polymerase subunit M/transcription elongation factor TFIIS